MDTPEYFLKMRSIKFSEILKYKLIPKSRPEDQNKYWFKKKKRICHLEDFAVPADDRIK